MDEYLVTGGMPQYVLAPEPQLLLNIIEDVIYKDIVKEFSVQDPGRLNDLFFLMMDRVGKRLSYSKMGNLVDIGSDAATRYIGFFRQTYLLHLCERWGSPNERKYSPKKIYCADNGFRTVLIGSRGIGSLAENLVFNIMRTVDTPHYGIVNDHEIDFIQNDLAVEVKYKDILDESDCLNILSLKHHRIKNKVMITRGSVEPPKGIRTIPLWRLAINGFD